LRVKSLPTKGPGTTATRLLAAAALGCALATNLLAGERIIMGKPGPVVNPLPRREEVDQQDSKFWNARGDSAPLMPGGYRPAPAMTDPRDEKRARQKQDEKRWWLVMGPEELQPKNGKTGIEEEPSALDDPNSLSRNGDYTFYGLGKDKRRPIRDATRKGDDNDKRRTGNDEEDSRDSHPLRKGLGDRLDYGGSRAARDGSPTDPFGVSQTRGLSENENTLRDYFAGLSHPLLSPADELQRSLKPDGALDPAGMDGSNNDLFSLGLPDRTGSASPGLPGPKTPVFGQSPESFGAPMARTAPLLPMPPGFGEPGGMRQGLPGFNPATPLLPKENEIKRPSVMGGSLFLRDIPRRQGL
jgi:hypothetical protein